MVLGIPLEVCLRVYDDILLLLGTALKDETVVKSPLFIFEYIYIYIY